MSRDKKSKVDDITKLRKILDNPSDPEAKKMISEDEKALSSVQKRLAGETTKTPKKPESFPRKYDTLKPKITIRTKTPPLPLPTKPLPTFQPVPDQPTKAQPSTTLPTFQPVLVQSAKVQPITPLPEFQLISVPAPTKPAPSTELLFANEALYEVEKIEKSIPEFYEVTPSGTPEKPSEIKTTMNPDSPPILEQNLPEWQPLEEPQPKEPEKTTDSKTTVEFQQVDPLVDSTSNDTKTSDAVPEFEPIDAPSPKITEKQDDWTILPSKEQPTETPLEVQFTATSEPPFQTLTKKQERDAKKTQKRKEKEAKKQKKLELRKLKKETKEKEREAKRLAKEQHSIESTPEKPADQKAEKPVLVPEEKPLKMNIDTTAFKGIESIDEKTAELLYKNGYFSIDNLKDATVDNLVQIQGIKRKLAKQIIKEVQEKTITPPETEFVPIKGKAHKTPLKEASDDITEWESYHVDDSSEPSAPVDACSYNGYTLYKQITSKNKGKKPPIHFFSKEKQIDSVPAQLPNGYQIAVNKKTGVPYLKKKK